MSVFSPSYRSILKYLVSGELKVKYKNRLLGAAWAVIDPLVLMVIYLVLIKYIFNRGGPTYAVELLLGLVTYRWFSTSLLNASRSLLSNGKLLQTVKFPYSVLPISRVFINAVDLLVGLLILLVFVFFYGVNFTWNWLWLIPLLVLEFQFIVACCLIVSIVGVYFRDLLNILTFGVRILLYASPILYAVDNLPAQYQELYMYASPLASLITSFKNVMIFDQPPSIYILAFMGLSAVLWLLAIYLFRTRKNIAKDL
jgi:ABC-type polysaccharide/polyol phosphate export permease